MGRKKKEDKKEYLYQSLASILLMFVGVIFLVVQLQPQTTPLKGYLVTYLGYSNIVFSIFLFVFGLYLSPFITIKSLNKRVLLGVFILFFSNLIFAGSLNSSIVLGNLLYSTFSSFIGSIGALFLSTMLLIVSLYLIFNTRLITFTQSFIGRFSFVDFSSLKLKLPSFQKDSDHADSDNNQLELSEEEKEIFNPDFVATEESIPEDSFDQKKKDTADYEVVSSLSEPVTLVRSGVTAEVPRSVVSSIGSVSGGISVDDLDTELTLDDSTNSEPKKSTLPYRNNIWEYPPLSILDDAKQVPADTGNIEGRKSTIEKTLKSFGIASKVQSHHVGPSVTQYALKVDEGVKTSRITNLQTDLALALASPNGQVRIEAPIPGTSYVGIEVPNLSQEFVFMKSMLTSPEYKKAKEKSKLTICLGKDVSGSNIYYPLNKMPHLLIAGATGSGKSIMIQAILSALLTANSPDECKLILVDPKRVELVQYNNIPHLITPVITEPSDAVNALKWVVGEMERRLQVLSSFGARNIEGYNEKSGFQAMPYIVVVLDELADLMMTSSNEVEKSIVRIAQLSRATGIHLVLATQRPSTDIITGSIKANVPARIAFNVASQVDSRVILDTTGAEKLLGKGDMLFVSPESSKPKRIQGVFVHDEEINRLVSFLKASDIDPDYNNEVVNGSEKTSSSNSGVKGSSSGYNDELFMEAAQIVIDDGKGSASLLQRRLSIGYARAARLLDELEEHGIVGSSEGSKAREVLVDSVDDILE